MARKPKEVEDRREQIIDAAMHVFAQKGFTRATNKDIALEADITPGLIYHYFESKKAVFEAVLEKRSPLSIIQSLPAEALAQPPEIFLPFLIKRIFAFLEDGKFLQLVRMILPEIIHNPQMEPVVAGGLQRAIGFMAQYLTSKMESGELRQLDPSFTAQAMIGCIMGFVLRRQLLQDSLALSYTQEQIVDGVLDIVFKGVLPQ